MLELAPININSFSGLRARQFISTKSIHCSVICFHRNARSIFDSCCNPDVIWSTISQTTIVFNCEPLVVIWSGRRRRHLNTFIKSEIITNFWNHNSSGGATCTTRINSYRRGVHWLWKFNAEVCITVCTKVSSSISIRPSGTY